MNNTVRIILCIWVFAVCGCASLPAKQPEATIVDANQPEADPWEAMNRATFAFNDRLDTYFLKPTALGYRFITPNFVQQGVANFFSNLGEVPNTINDILQWKWKKAANDSGRFVVNSTFGVGGLFEVAAHAGLKRNDPESFGQTFSYWGIPRGPYLVLPFFGPSTVTDTVGLPLHWETLPQNMISDANTEIALAVFNTVETRANLLDAERLISGDRYIFIRDAYLQRRDYLVRDGEADPEELEDFGEEFDAFDEDF